jgi:tRNA(Ile)-lysidine synthase
MSFKLTHSLPDKCLVAVSGGVDSMTALHWLNKVEGRVRGVIHVNHGTGHFADQAEKLVRDAAHSLKLPIFFFHLTRDPEEGASLESYWRDQRYRFFKEASTISGNFPVALGHNFDDCLEEYIMCTMVRGFSGTIPYAHDPCIRPFRLWKRSEIEEYAKKHSIPWMEDPSNLDHTRFMRAKIRKLVAPRVRYLNPGVYNIVEKVISVQDERDKEGTIP